MVLSDFRIYGAHAVFWLTFAAGDFAARRRSSSPAPVPTPDAVLSVDAPIRAPRARLLMGLHMIAFALMYAGVGNAVFGTRLPAVPSWQVSAGALVIFAGGLLACWARLAFASWRFKAQLDRGHQLATGGPFRFIRHPIYAGLDLLALGTALWIPTPLACLGLIAMVAGGDLRARAEEPLLVRAFGETYREYQRRTSRFVPGVY